MKRQIKFKGWNSIVGRMSDPMTLREIYETKGVQWHIVDWLQYIGLKDKNRVEIYEGDILELPNRTLGVVKWLECGFVFIFENEKVWQNLLFNVTHHYTIVENIYENPELLNKKSKP